MASIRQSEALRSSYAPYSRRDLPRCPSSASIPQLAHHHHQHQQQHQLMKDMESRLAATSGAVSSSRGCEKTPLRVSNPQPSSSAPSSLQTPSARYMPKSRSSGALLSSLTLPITGLTTPIASPVPSPIASSSSTPDWAESAAVDTDPFSRLPDDVVVEILSHLDGGAPDVLAASMTCRRWQALSHCIPVLRFLPRDMARAGATAGAGSAGQESASPLPPCSALQREELVSRMVLKSSGLQHLQVTSSLLPPQPAASPASPSSAPASPSDGCPYGRCLQQQCTCGSSSSGNSALISPTASPQHPREFIFEAWMRHVGSQLQSLVLSRSLNAAANGGGSTTINVWENEDLSLHLGHISRYCRNLRSLTLGSLSLAAPALETCLRPMPQLQNLSLSWIHLTNESLQAILDATPNLRRLTIFMATGCPQISLRLPASLEHIDFAYLRAESCSLVAASSLRTVSIRDMFVRSVTIRQAPRLRHVAVASASLLEVSAPESFDITSLDLKAGSFCWSALQTLIRSSGASLHSLALDFFTAGAGATSSGIFSLFWLAVACPALRALNLGALPWQLVLNWASTSGALQAARSAAEFAPRWPQLEELKLKVQEQRPEALLLLHALLTNVPTLRSLQVATAVDEEEEEDDEEEEEESEEVEYDEEEEEAEDEEEEEEYEEDEEAYVEDDVEEGDWMEVEEDDAESVEEEEDEEEDTSMPPVRTGRSAGQRQMSRQELFLKGLVCLQQRFSDVNVFLPLLARRSTV